MKRLSILLGVAGALLLALVIGTLVYQNMRKAPAASAAAADKGSLTQFYSPTLGSAEAKVHIVEFLDPACETCASFFPYVKQILAENPGRVRLTVRLLGFHKGSDYAVKALEAARKQGKFWPALEALLSRQALWAPNHTVQPELVWKALDGLGLNFEQMKSDMNSPEIAQHVAQDMKDAQGLKVTQTPEYFVNGRPLPSFGLEQLQTLVKETVQSAYK